MIHVPKNDYCDLGKRIQAGDVFAFEVLFHQLHKPVYNRAFAMLKNHCDAEDAAQEVFIKIWQKSTKWDPSLGGYMGWFLTLAERSIIDAYRKQQRYQKKTDSIDKNIVDAIDDEDDNILTALELFPDPRQDALGQVIADEMMRRIEEALISVDNRRYRLAWILRHLEDYTPPEISKIMGHPENTCKIWIYRCRVKMREILAETYTENERR